MKCKRHLGVIFFGSAFPVIFIVLKNHSDNLPRALEMTVIATVLFDSGGPSSFTFQWTRMNAVNQRFLEQCNTVTREAA